MKVVFISNFFSHLQKPVSDELYRITNGNYTFIATKDLSDERKLMCFDDIQPKYVCRYNEDSKNHLDSMINGADIVIIGAAPLSLIKKRLHLGLLTYRYSERYYKTRSRYLKYPYWWYNAFITRKSYYLCSGAYTSRDVRLTGFFKNKCFKWGYFPEVKVFSDIDALLQRKDSIKNKKISIIWAARLIRLKHPEYVVELAHRLKLDGYLFVIHILGNGIMENIIKNQITKYDLEGYVLLHGAVHPDVVRKYMEDGDIFLMTSDRNEGWGAVLNEAMNSACAVVSSHAVGSAPFLIKDGENGLIFKSGNKSDLYNKTKMLMDNKSLRCRLGKKAYLTMVEVWNAHNAAENIIKLSKTIIDKSSCTIIDGPCSKAEIM